MALDELEKSDFAGFDVVLMDIQMPEMDGLTLLAKINEQYPLIKSVIVSAYGDMSNIRTALNRGAFDFVPRVQVLARKNARWVWLAVEPGGRRFQRRGPPRHGGAHSSSEMAIGFSVTT